jgi:hypothetical protein
MPVVVISAMLEIEVCIFYPRQVSTVSPKSLLWFYSEKFPYYFADKEFYDSVAYKHTVFTKNHSLLLTASTLALEIHHRSSFHISPVGINHKDPQIVLQAALDQQFVCSVLLTISETLFSVSNTFFILDSLLVINFINNKKNQTM